MCSSPNETDPNRRDFMVEIAASTLRRIRNKLAGISKIRFRFADISLALATLAGGGFLTALSGGSQFGINQWWLFYSICPVVTVAGLVTYFFMIHFPLGQSVTVANDILAELPDPDQLTPKFTEKNRLAGPWQLDSSTTPSGKKTTGIVNIHVTGGRISAAGQLYGEFGSPIAEISSVVCDYEPGTRLLSLIYQVSAHNDDGSQVTSRCVLSGILFDNEEGGGSEIKCNWYHVGGKLDKVNPCGTAKLSRLQAPSGVSGEESV